MDGIDWQTVFYVLSSLTMLAFLSMIVAVIMLVNKIKNTLTTGVRSIATMGSLMRISALRSLLKLLR